MNVYAWQVLITVVEQGSFVRAADALNVSQSAVSHSIAKLEEECGYQLLNRTRSGISLTTNAEVLLPYVRQLINSDNALSQQVAKLKDIDTGVVKVAAFHSATVMWLPDIIRNFNSAHPGIKVIVKQSGDKGIRDMLEANEVDLAITTRDSVPAELSFMPLHNTELIGVTSEDFVPANGVSITIDDYLNNDIILPYEGYDTEMIKYFDDNGVSVNYSFRIEDDDTLLSMVEQGFGISLLPLMTVRCLNRRVREWKVDTVRTRLIGIATVFPDCISPAAHLLRQEIIKYINENNLINL